MRQLCEKIRDSLKSGNLLKNEKDSIKWKIWENNLKYF